LSEVLLIALLVPSKLLPPKLNPGLGHPVSHGAIMLMPETPMDEDHLSSTAKHEIWATR
jgi:hypothetical protein